MNNKVNVTNQHYQTIRLVALLLLLPTVLAIIVLFTFHSLDARNYNGHVTEVSGTVTSIVEDENDITITLDNDTTYNANRIHTCYPDFDLDSLFGKEVTFVLPEMQVGKDSIPTWILGVKQGDEILIDYKEVIADGKAEAKLAMIISGVIAGLFAVAALAVFYWRTKITPTKEESLYKAYSEFAAALQPSCPQYKNILTATLVYLGVMILLVAVPLGAIYSTTENSVAQISVAVVACFLFIACSVGLLVYVNILTKKEREFYANNFPFDLDDISHLATYGKKQKMQKQETQEKLREERKKFPHRYYDAGNNFTVDFTENGVELFEEDYSANLNADVVFSEDEKSNVNLVCRLAYKELRFEALPHYRKKDHPLTVIIKSRIEDNIELPKEMTNDLHFMLDSNLLATLRNFNVEVENLQYILDNKAQLIKENCERRRKQK